MTSGILLLSLAIFKATQFWKLNGFHGSRLIFVLVRDQVVYFVMYVAPPASAVCTDVSLSAISVVIFAIISDLSSLSNGVAVGILSTLASPSLLSILGSHLFFNIMIKEAAEHGVNVGTNWSSHSHTTISFDEPLGGDDL